MFDSFALNRVDLGDVTIRVRHGGTGTPVVLLHGHPVPTPPGTASRRDCALSMPWFVRT